jgi:transcriptional regulator with XRE-family HTH domain
VATSTTSNGTNGSGTSSPLGPFGDYLRSQRRLAQLTLRELSDLTNISNPYLSQLERGMHAPSVRVIKSLAKALNLSAEALLAQAAGIDDTADPAPDSGVDTETAIRHDKRLTDPQKDALITVYRSFLTS